MKAPQKMSKSFGTTSFLTCLFFPTKWLASSGMFSGCQRVGLSELNNIAFHGFGGMMGMMFPQNHHQNPGPADFFFVAGKKKGKKTPFWRQLILKDSRKLSNLHHLCKGLGVRQHEFLANGVYWSVLVATAPTPTLQEYPQQNCSGVLTKRPFSSQALIYSLCIFQEECPSGTKMGPKASFQNGAIVPL